MTAQPLILYGAGGHGKVVWDAALSMGLRPDFVVDDDPHVTSFLGEPLLEAGQFRWRRFGRFHFVVSIGDNEQRARIFARLMELGGTPVNLVHRGAVVSTLARLGRGNVVVAGAIINPGAVIADNCIINTAATVDHDCRIDAHVHLCPGVHLAGNVHVGQGTLIGTGASSIPGVSVGPGSIVGAGSVLVRNIPGQVVAYGMPAKVKRPVRRHAPASGLHPIHERS